MHLCRILVFCFFAFGLNSFLHANWNADFDEQTRRLMNTISTFNSKTYVQEYEQFYETRELLLKDGSLKRQLADMPTLNKAVILRPRQGLAIKKRADNQIKELFAWEISLLLGSSSCLLPSFPVEISGKKVIVQKMEPFTFGRGDQEAHSPSSIKKVSLDMYFKAHLQAYILGIRDLLGRNIGINTEGKIRFFDVEDCLCYRDEIIKFPTSVHIGYMSESFDWPQYRIPLDKKTAESIRAFVAKLASLEEKARLYQECRGFFVLNDPFLRRLEKVRSFPFEEGKTFRDFFGFVYPSIDAGLDDLNRIVSHIYKRKVDHGVALNFLGQHLKRAKLSSEERRSIDEWIATYVD